MRSRAASVLRLAALAVFALSLLAAVPAATARAVLRLGRAVASLGEDARAARVRLWGAPTVAALDAIRSTIPPDGEYLLVDGGGEWEAAIYWVRFELAPRRARFAGRLSELGGPSPHRPRLPAGPRWVVIAMPRGPAQLLERVELERRLGGANGRR